MGDDEDKKRLYVGSLSFNTDNESLRAHFEQIGEVIDGKRINSEYLSLLYRGCVHFSNRKLAMTKVLDFHSVVYSVMLLRQHCSL